MRPTEQSRVREQIRIAVGVLPAYTMSMQVESTNQGHGHGTNYVRKFIKGERYGNLKITETVTCLVSASRMVPVICTRCGSTRVMSGVSVLAHKSGNVKTCRRCMTKEKTPAVGFTSQCADCPSQRARGCSCALHPAANACLPIRHVSGGISVAPAW